MQQYKCHKVVSAGKIVKINELDDVVATENFLQLVFEDASSREVSMSWVERHHPMVGDYMVCYDDGHMSCSPAKVFEDGYEKLQENYLNFGQAIEALKFGRSVARSGWNGKGIFIKMQFPDAHSKMSSQYIYIDTTGLDSDNPDAPRSLVPWLASQTDMISEDWQIVE